MEEDKSICGKINPILYYYLEIRITHCVECYTKNYLILNRDIIIKIIFIAASRFRVKIVSALTISVICEA